MARSLQHPLVQVLVLKRLVMLFTELMWRFCTPPQASASNDVNEVRKLLQQGCALNVPLLNDFARLPVPIASTGVAPAYIVVRLGEIRQFVPLSRG